MLLRPAFSRLSLLFSGDYLHAEEAFAGVARVLPLAEVLNNQGVALARNGQDGIPLFREAAAADPDQADYHFNLAVSLKRHGNTAEALTELAECLRLRPTTPRLRRFRWPGRNQTSQDLPKPGLLNLCRQRRPAHSQPPLARAGGAGESDEEAGAKRSAGAHRAQL